MKTNPFLSFFLWLSNTDEKLYALCPQNVKRARVSLGIFVFITGIFATVTGSFFIRSMFNEYDEVSQTINVSTLGWIVSSIFGLVWGFLIIEIDRSIVSAHSKWSAALRIPLAIIIGLAVAIPFKVQFFSDRIYKELRIASQMENAGVEDRKTMTINQINEKINNLEKNIDTTRKQIVYWNDIMQAETVGKVKTGSTGKAGQGPAWESAKHNYDLLNEYEQKYSEELEKINNEKDAIIENAKDEFNQSKIKQSFDFLSQYERMEIMKNGNKTLGNFALLLTLLFILIETIPAFMKLFKSSDEYDVLLHVRTNISKQIAFAYGNFAIDEIANAQNISVLSQKNFQFSPKEIINQISLNLL